MIYLYKKTHNKTGLQYLGIEQGAKHKGRTWKIINGKRTWMDKV